MERDVPMAAFGRERLCAVGSEARRQTASNRALRWV
jgi:hypothetical protein